MTQTNTAHRDTGAQDAQAPVKAQSKFSSVIRVTSGNFIEMYDFFLFGFYATHIANAFFPASSEYAALMMTFATFGAGFFMRPLGAIILGSYIDRIGRRKGLVLTLAISEMLFLIPIVVAQKHLLLTNHLQLHLTLQLSSKFNGHQLISNLSLRKVHHMV